jgi:hypothetical protein
MTSDAHKPATAEQNDPNGPRLKFRKTDLMCGEEHLVSIGQPSVIVDSHMHIQSGRCAPLQYVRSLFKLTSFMSRKWIETSGGLGGHLLEALFEPYEALSRAIDRAFGDAPRNPDEGNLG